MKKSRATHCVKCGDPIDAWRFNSRAVRCQPCQDKRNDARVRLRDARKAVKTCLTEEARQRNFEAIPRLAAEHDAT